MSDTAGGYDYFFLDEPPSDLICPICHLVASSPQQVSCCGRVYCDGCLAELKQRSKWLFRCANCREDEPSSFPDRKTSGQINALRVACTKREDGCDWRGALRELAIHLKHCDYADIHCPFSSLGCPARPLRKDILQHEAENMQYHLNLAVKKVESLEGGAQQERKLLEKKLSSSITEARNALLMHKKETKRIIHRGIESQKEEISDQMKTFKNELASEQRLPPVVFRVKNFSDLQDEDEDWHSASFYTHAGGYRMCLRLYTNGSLDVRGTHLSCFVYLMRGTYDEHLVWPFRGTIYLELLNQLQDSNHHVEKVAFSSSELKNYNTQVKKGNLGVTGLGRSKFINQTELGLNSELNRQFLKDDCLFIRVSKVEIQSVLKPWLACPIDSNYDDDDDNEEY